MEWHERNTDNFLIDQAPHLPINPSGSTTNSSHKLMDLNKRFRSTSGWKASSPTEGATKRMLDTTVEATSNGISGEVHQ